MNDITSRKWTEMGLRNELETLVESYMKIYDEYHSDNCSRDAVFIHDLVDGIKGTIAITEVYARDGNIHPGYALEKLHWSKSFIESCERYFENKLKKEM